MTVEPLKHIGPAFGSLIKGIFQDMPLHMYPIALGCFMVIFIVILIMTCGYSINFMHLITIHAPARKEPAPIVPPPQNNRLLYEVFIGNLKIVMLVLLLYIHQDYHKENF